MYKFLCKYQSGIWLVTSKPKDEDAVNSIGDSVIYKMGYTFGLAKTQAGVKSPHFKSSPGDFLVVAKDGSLAAMKKDTYSKYFPKQGDVIQSTKKTNKDL